ncbi:MAG: glycosyltransferase family 4 protein [Acidimicrobiales bacterium]
MKHLLVTNDFPPKLGGIQSYLWELWRRLPAASFSVLTIAQPGDAAFDSAQAFAVERVPAAMLLPTPSLTRRIKALARATGAGLVVLDPALPLGLVGPALGLPYAVVIHGAEVSVPARLPGARQALARVLRGARLVVAGSRWTEGEGRRAAGPAMGAVLALPPGVDHHRFRPLDAGARAAARRRHGLDPEGRLVLSVGRMVPRKGMDTLVEATARLAPSRPDLTVAVVGTGRTEPSLRRRAAALAAPVRFLGRRPDGEMPGLHGAADVFAMACRTRWAGMEQEGFGIVFLEAAACGVAQVAGRSGGAGEAVLHGRTGLVVDRPADPGALADCLAALLDDEGYRSNLGRAARSRVEQELTYDSLAGRLANALGC